MGLEDWGFLIDLDGVIYRGDRVIPEAVAFLDRIRSRPHLFLTNNSDVTPGQMLQKLGGMGIPVGSEAVFYTSAIATADYLREAQPDFTYYAVGGRGLHEALSAAGHADPSDPDYVVVGEGEGLDYRSLIRGITILKKGRARLVGTNPDVNLDGTWEGRPAVIPGCGALIAPFQVGSGVEPVFVGKPEPLMYVQGLHRLGREPERTVMIGDRPDTDIQGAARLGIRTILVTTGRHRPGDPYPEGIPPPDLIVDSLDDVVEGLRRDPTP